MSSLSNVPRMNKHGMFDETLDRSLGFLLNDVSRQMRNRFDRNARALGLTRAQWRVMMFLRRHEGSRQSELAALLEVENVTLGRHIDRLEDRVGSNAAAIHQTVAPGFFTLQISQCRSWTNWRSFSLKPERPR